MGHFWSLGIFYGLSVPTTTAISHFAKAAISILYHSFLFITIVVIIKALIRWNGRARFKIYPLAVIEKQSVKWIFPKWNLTRTGCISQKCQSQHWSTIRFGFIQTVTGVFGFRADINPVIRNYNALIPSWRRALFNRF